MPAVPPSPPPLTACGATAAPPQTGRTALICAAHDGKLDCLDHLIAKGANLNAQSMVRRGPAAPWRRGRGVGVGSERLGDAARRRLPRCPAVPRDGVAPLVPLRPSAAAPPRRPAASWWPSAARLACKLSERGRRGGGRGVGWGVASAYDTRYPPQPLTRVCGTAVASRQGKVAVLHDAALFGHASCVESLLKAGADVSLKNEVSDCTEGRGGGRWGGQGEGRSRVWEGPCAGAAPLFPAGLPPLCRLSTSSPLHRPLSPVAVAPDGDGPCQAGKLHGDRQASGGRGLGDVMHGDFFACL